MAEKRPSEKAPPTSSKKKIRKFKKEWLKEESWSWLRYDDEKGAMFCDLCIKHNKKNTYVTGCTDLQKSSIERHALSNVHRSSEQAKAHATAWKKCEKTAEQKNYDTLIPQLRTVKFLAEESLPLVKYKKLIELQQINGANISNPYTHHQQVEEMVEAISDTLSREIQQAVSQSKFVGILIDESVDIAVFKKLVIYIQVVIKGRVKVYFAANKDVMDGCADTIMTALKVRIYSVFFCVFFYALKKIHIDNVISAQPSITSLFASK